MQRTVVSPAEPALTSTRAPILVSLAVFLLLAGGCARFDSTRGVEVGWDEPALAGLRIGESTRTEVLDRLGPPSQVIAVGDETALYYMLEREQGEALILGVFNRLDMAAHYDRAIFFFDDAGVLTDYSTRVGEGVREEG